MDTGEAWRDPAVAARFSAQRSAIVPESRAQIDVLLHVLRSRERPVERILDLGAGDGILVATLLDAFPDACGIAVDYSFEMLARATERLAPYEGRATVQPADLRSPDWLRVLPGPVDVIVSGFAIHHLPDTRKRTLFGELFLSLQPGGTFLNLEHVASPTPALEALFEHAMVDFQLAQRLAAGEDVDRALVWQQFHTRPDKADNRLAPLEQQCEWLREFGFVDVDCFWKWFELAIFGGHRGGYRPCS